MTSQSNSVIFLISLVALYFYLNTCRRLLVSTSPVFLSRNVLSEEFYGVLSSTTSILFGICRFVAYSLLDIFSVDSYVTVLTICSCCICIFFTFVLKDLTVDSISILLGAGFVLLFICVGLPFPSSSVIIRKYFSGKERNFVWSLLSISSCIGSIIAATLSYYLKDPSDVFRWTGRFGLFCIVCFYVFFPTNKQETKKDETKKTITTSLSRGQEIRSLLLCFVSYFIIYLSRRIISEWSLVYTAELFPVDEKNSHSLDSTHTMYTLTTNLYEIASIISLLLFGSLSRSMDLSSCMSIYTTIAVFGAFLPQLASSLHLPWLNYVASFITGFFLSVPYASLDLVIMDLCCSVNVNRALSLTSLLSQVAAALAGYPVHFFFTHVCSFYYTPFVLSILLGVASLCLWKVHYSMKTMKDSQKEKNE